MAKSGRVLLIIDVQNDFCPGGSLAVPEGDAVIPVINRLAAGFPLVVATKDWHPEGHVSFASRYPGRKPGDTLPGEAGPQWLWPDHCIRGTGGADFHPDLDVRRIGLVLHKGTRLDLDSYSAFFENDGKTPTGLEYYLKGLGVREVFLAGLAEDVCVLSSALDAKRLDFETYVVMDATRGVNQPEGGVARARELMEKQGVHLIRSGEV